MRKTTPQDGADILEMLTDYYIENQKKMPMKVNFDIPTVRKFLEQALTHPNLISYIADDGIVFGELSETWFGPNKVSRGLVWYVKPKARNGILAKNLLEAFDDEARERGAIYGRMEIDNPANLPTVGRMLKHAGYDQFSNIYLRKY